MTMSLFAATPYLISLRRHVTHVARDLMARIRNLILIAIQSFCSCWRQSTSSYTLLEIGCAQGVHINNVMQGCSSHKGSSKSEPQFIKELCPEKGNLNLWLAQRDLGAADDDVVAGRSISIRA